MEPGRQQPTRPPRAQHVFGAAQHAQAPVLGSVQHEPGRLAGQPPQLHAVAPGLSTHVPVGQMEPPQVLPFGSTHVSVSMSQKRPPQHGVAVVAFALLMQPAPGKPFDAGGEKQAPAGQVWQQAPAHATTHCPLWQVVPVAHAAQDVPPLPQARLLVPG